MSTSARSSSRGKTREYPVVLSTELHDECEFYKAEYEKAKQQIAQQEGLIAYLREASAKKDVMIATLEEEVSRLERIHKQEIQVLDEEAKTKSLEDSHHIRCLTLERDRLQEELKIYHNLQKENAQMRDTIINLQTQIERVQKSNQKDYQQMRADMHDYCKIIEEQFKSKLREAETEYRDAAYREMDEEARQALEGNSKLQVILNSQNQNLEEVLSKLKALEQAHKKMKAEKEMNEETLNYKSEEMRRLKTELSAAQSKVVDLKENLRKISVERASFELLYEELEKAKRDSDRAKEKYQNLKKETEKWKERAHLLKYIDAHNSGLSGERLEELLRVQDQMAQSSREKKEKMKMKAIHRVSRTAGVGGVISISYELNESDEEGNSDDDDDNDDKDINDALNVLSVWNSNFANKSSKSNRSSNSNNNNNNNGNDNAIMRTAESRASTASFLNSPTYSIDSDEDFEQQQQQQQQNQRSKERDKRLSRSRSKAANDDNNNNNTNTNTTNNNGSNESKEADADKPRSRLRRGLSATEKWREENDRALSVLSRASNSRSERLRKLTGASSGSGSGSGPSSRLSRSAAPSYNNNNNSHDDPVYRSHNTNNNNTNTNTNNNNIVRRASTSTDLRNFLSASGAAVNLKKQPRFLLP